MIIDIRQHWSLGRYTPFQLGIYSKWIKYQGLSMKIFTPRLQMRQTRWKERGIKSLNKKREISIHSPTCLIVFWGEKVSSRALNYLRDRYDMRRSLSSSLVVGAIFALLLREISAVKTDVSNLRRRSPDDGTRSLCSHLIRPNGYPCTEHTVQSVSLSLPSFDWAF